MYKELLVEVDDFTFKVVKNHYTKWCNQYYDCAFNVFSSSFVVSINVPALVKDFNLSQQQAQKLQNIFLAETSTREEARKYFQQAFESVLPINTPKHVLSLRCNNNISYYTINSYYPLTEKNLILRGRSGSWNFEEIIQNQFNKVDLPKTFNTRKQALLFAHDFLKNHLYELYVSTSKPKLFPPAGKLWWHQFVKPAVNLQEVFEC